MTQDIARDARGVSHALAFETFSDALRRPAELTTLCRTRGLWRHLITWWSPLAMELMPGQVDCIACLIAEARR